MQRTTLPCGAFLPSLLTRKGSTALLPSHFAPKMRDWRCWERPDRSRPIADVRSRCMILYAYLDALSCRWARIRRGHCCSGIRFRRKHATRQRSGENVAQVWVLGRSDDDWSDCTFTISGQHRSLAKSVTAASHHLSPFERRQPDRLASMPTVRYRAAKRTGRNRPVVDANGPLRCSRLRAAPRFIAPK